ncbi:MAG: hypothetical protein R3B09_18445 [Nannocystaceae bacterium]
MSRIARESRGARTPGTPGTPGSRGAGRARLATLPRLVLTTLPRLALALLLGALAPSCAKKDGGTAPPGAQSEPRFDGDGALDDYERVLLDEERRLQSAGVALGDAKKGEWAAKEEAGAEDMSPETSPPEVAESPGADDGSPRAPRRERRRESSRCVEVCGLSTSICDLEVQICGLAQRHPDEPRYHQVCARASDDCTSAREACNACG